MTPAIRAAIARITVGTSRGTGVLVSDKALKRNLVLTSFHVLGDVALNASHSNPITVEFAQLSSTATIERYNAAQDWALLRCANPVEATPLLLYHLRQSGVPFVAYGFPDAQPLDGMAVGGQVRNHRAEYLKTPVLQLFCEEAAAADGMPVRGLSGGPCLFEGTVIGIFRASLMGAGSGLNVAGTLYACPSDVVAEACRDILEWPDPCAGLSGVDAPFPREPFRYLAPYGASEASVFSGRCREIKMLMSILESKQPASIIILHGESGVGKSSLLHSGLLPRSRRTWRYIRRDPIRGLLGSFTDLLGQNPISGWRALDSGGAHSLLVLDQIEEVWTKPIADRDELGEFLSLVGPVLTDSPIVRGTLMLSIRSEWFKNLEERLKAWKGLRWEEVRIGALDREAIVEIITALTPVASSGDPYRLDVTPSELPGSIADDLLEDRQSPIAPMLQILMTRMWELARSASSPAGRRTITRDMYVAQKTKGFHLEDFLSQQLSALRENPAFTETVSSGLALDVLGYHITALDTAASRLREDVVNRYRNSPLIEPLLQALQDLFLLAGSESNVHVTRLAHDTLARHVRMRIATSQAAGQRASRILEARAVLGDDGTQVAPLYDLDLGLVEAGATGMRAWDPHEAHLVEISRSLRNRRRRTRRMAYILAALTGLGVIASAAWSIHSAEVAKAAAYEAQRQQRIAMARQLNTQIANLKLREPRLIRERALLAILAWKTAPNPQASQYLADALTSLNYSIGRFAANRDGASVSANGKYVVSWSRTNGALTVQEITDAGLRDYWTGKVSAEEKWQPTSLVVSSDGRIAAGLFGMAELSKRALLVALRQEDPSGQKTPVEILRIPGDAHSPLPFTKIRISAHDEYLWGTDFPPQATPPEAYLYDLTEGGLALHIPSTNAISFIDVSPDSRHVAVLSSNSIQLGLIGPLDLKHSVAVFGLPAMHFEKSFTYDMWHTSGIKFASESKDILVTGEGFVRILDWASPTARVAKTAREDFASSIHAPRAVAFSGQDETAVFTDALGALDDVARPVNPSPFAAVLRDWKTDYPILVGQIESVGSGIGQGPLDENNITSISAQAPNDRVVTTDRGGHVTLWEPVLRYGVPRLMAPNWLTALFMPTVGDRLFLLDVKNSRGNDNPDDQGPLVADPGLIAVDDWNTLAPHPQAWRSLPVDSGPLVPAISPTGEWMATVADQGTAADGLPVLAMRLRPLSGTGDGRILRFSQRPEFRHPLRIEASTLSADGTFLAVLDDWGHVTIWNVGDKGRDTPTHDCESKAPGHDFEFSPASPTLAVSRHGDAVAVAVNDELHVCTARPAENDMVPSWTFKVPTPDILPREIASVVVSPRDEFLAIGSEDGHVRVWTQWLEKSPHLLRDFSMQIDQRTNRGPAPVVALAFHPREPVIAIQDAKDIQVLDLAQDEPWMRLANPISEPRENRAASVAFANDGRFVVSAQRGAKDYRVWIWRPTDMIKEACDKLLLRESEFTDEMWKRYVSFGNRTPICPMETNPSGPQVPQG